MTVKRRNHGRNKHGRGHVKRSPNFILGRCTATAKAIPKDKAIQRFIVRNIVDASSLRDIRDSSAYDNYALPKLYIKNYYCIEAAVHQRIVRVRSREDRKNRNPPWKIGLRCDLCDYKKTAFNAAVHNQIKNGHEMNWRCPSTSFTKR